MDETRIEHQPNGGRDRRPGISGIAVELPVFRVDLGRFCTWTGADQAKTRAVVGDSFRLAGPDENAYTLAAGAVLRLLDAFDVDPSDVGMLVLATESSEDNAAGAVIVRGLVDEALEMAGRPPLARDCEVPEIKHACLAGVYGIEQAVRFVATDGRGRVAIVVASDLAVYARGSSGEPTQGAGAVAMLVESEARLLGVDLDKARGSSWYRGVDFRKPMARWFDPAYLERIGAGQDVPVFNGRYSTACYSEAVAAALEAFCDGNGDGCDPWRILDAYDRFYFHRPYAHMPVQGLAFAMTYVAARAGGRPAWWRKAAEAAKVSYEDVEACARRPVPRHRDVGPQTVDQPFHPMVDAVAKALRRQPEFAAWVRDKMALGEASMRNFGNLYAASLPACLAAGLDAAATGGVSVDGERWLAVGYGSGDAAEIVPLAVAPGATRRATAIRLGDVLARSRDLGKDEYAALHAKRWEPWALKSRPRAWFVARRGRTGEGAFVDVGIPYFEFHEAPPRPSSRPR